jgi:hypothetical protein
MSSKSNEKNGSSMDMLHVNGCHCHYNCFICSVRVDIDPEVPNVKILILGKEGEIGQ